MCNQSCSYYKYRYKGKHPASDTGKDVFPLCRAIAKLIIQFLSNSTKHRNSSAYNNGSPVIKPEKAEGSCPKHNQEPKASVSQLVPLLEKINNLTHLLLLLYGYSRVYL